MMMMMMMMMKFVKTALLEKHKTLEHFVRLRKFSRLPRRILPSRVEFERKATNRAQRQELELWRNHSSIHDFSDFSSRQEVVPFLFVGNHHYRHEDFLASCSYFFESPQANLSQTHSISKLTFPFRFVVVSIWLNNPL